ncbi:protein Jumonji-like isoform X2 [Entelurus aequoreus]|uniref:protein Jumonji-like isoform X2 n=1 Tax=Entelurus aequoreus TaxID=161455 RepID=UPI002B1E3ABA|nr:protein Jumonji-like isoform X2 [Entelurus aequoreus]
MSSDKMSTQSTQRPKRNIIKKTFDMSDGMPWCEERLVRKVLFLSLREFRDGRRAAHARPARARPARAHSARARPACARRTRQKAAQRVSDRLQRKKKMQAVQHKYTQSGPGTQPSGPGTQPSGPGSVLNGVGRRRPLLSGGPSWSWSLQTRPQCQHPDPDPRPKVQAQRKFAQSPPTSPCPLQRTSTRHNFTLVSSLRRCPPKTEDFLSFLCLRGSAALPRNFLKGREDAAVRHVASVSKHKHLKLFAQELGGGASAVTCLSARALRRRERERKDEERSRKKKMEEETRRHYLRPRHLAIQLRTKKKVTKGVRLTEPRASFVRSVAALKPKTGPGGQPASGPSNKRQSGGRLRDSDSSQHSQPSNQQLPHNQHLNLSKFNRKNLRTFQNSGKKSVQMTTHLAPPTETSGVMRLSRRRRGLPPDTSPTPINHFPTDNPVRGKRKYRTPQSAEDLQLDMDCCNGDTLVKEASCNQDANVNRVNAHTRGCGALTPAKNASFTQDNRVDVGIGQLDPANIKDKSELGEIIYRHMREKELRKNPTASPSTSRTSVSNTVAAVPQASTNLAASAKVRNLPPASTSVMHNNPNATEEDKLTSPASSCSVDTSKGGAKHSRQNRSCSRTSKGGATDSRQNKSLGRTSEGGAKDSRQNRSYSRTSKGGATDSRKNRSYTRTSKGSTKPLQRTKSTTSTMTTRSSPRVLLKR